ncbi:hypothetical protein KIN20_032916 [Parelaphostrongylus tenuis]|uniref:Uncharacterized protein n=1 Tax=Parelaphostrongylus tenuis TaxID=148309 RepID=A0AAD5WI05_PARTN|nr:hypothetical protein KIN20_032916 [Parelaphostrongylus tenuis]
MQTAIIARTKANHFTLQKTNTAVAHQAAQGHLPQRNLEEVETEGMREMKSLIIASLVVEGELTTHKEE